MTNHNLLANSYIFYEKHHKHYLNKIIHLICIPILVWTTTVFLSLIPLGYNLNSDIYLLKPVQLNIASIVALLYCLYYLYLDYKIGKLFVFLFTVCLYTSNLFIIKFNEKSLAISLILHISSWILQILSHKIIEGNQPALVTGIFQSFTMAPFFVILEIYFYFNKRNDILSKINQIKKNDKKMQHFQIKLN